jgi:hypothetical protein
MCKEMPGTEIVPLPALIGINEFQPDIPRQVGLHQNPLPLHRPPSGCDKLSLLVNQYGDNGNRAASVNTYCLPEALAA